MAGNKSNLQTVKDAENALLAYKKEHNILNSVWRLSKTLLGWTCRMLETVEGVSAVVASGRKLKNMDRMSALQLSSVEEVLQNGLVQRLKSALSIYRLSRQSYCGSICPNIHRSKRIK